MKQSCFDLPSHHQVAPSFVKQGVGWGQIIPHSFTLTNSVARTASGEADFGVVLGKPRQSHPCSGFQGTGESPAVTSIRLSTGCPADVNSNFGWNLLRKLNWAMFGTEKYNSSAGPGLKSTMDKLSKGRWRQGQGKACSP